MFAGSVEGAHNLATVYSIMATCKLNDINPYEYCREVLEKLPQRKANDIEDLLPTNWKPSVEKEIPQKRQRIALELNTSAKKWCILLREARCSSPGIYVVWSVLAKRVSGGLDSEGAMFCPSPITGKYSVVSAMDESSALHIRTR